MYSTHDLQEFVNLKKTEKQLKAQTELYNQEIAKLQNILRDVAVKTHDNKLNLEQYKELDKCEGMFNFVVEAKPIKNFDRKYVKATQKEAILLKMFSDYQALNPQATKIPFSWLSETLANVYKIKTRSISNFFTGILSRYELTGGPRNKCVTIP